MSSDDRSNDFFGHLDQPAPPTPRRVPRPPGVDADADYEVVPDPFVEGEPAPARPSSGTHARPAPRTPSGEVPRPAPRPPTGEQPRPAPRGPGLSPGIPKLGQPPTREAPRSGVVLTPGGVKRVEDGAARPRKATPSAQQQRPPSGQAPQKPASGQAAQAGQTSEFHAASREKNDADDVSWEEYAASDFPAMTAEEFGVKTRMSGSGRVVPVAVRADLTDEALKNRSIKGKGGRPRPQTQEARSPRSFMQRISDSLRRRVQEQPAAEEGSTRGFARSGSMPGKKGKRTPLRVAWNVVVEIGKILLLVLLLRAYVVQVSEVTGPSMIPTLQERDRLVVERITPLFSDSTKWWVRMLPQFARPELGRGDLVVVRSPEDPGLELVKRLIALPGDAIKFEDGRLWLKPAGASNFEKVNEDYIQSEDLKNPYGVMVVNPANHPGVRDELAHALVDYLISAKRQALIRDYKIDGESLFYPQHPAEQE